MNPWIRRVEDVLGRCVPVVDDNGREWYANLTTGSIGTISDDRKWILWDTSCYPKSGSGSFRFIEGVRESIVDDRLPRGVHPTREGCRRGIMGRDLAATVLSKEKHMGHSRWCVALAGNRLCFATRHSIMGDPVSRLSITEGMDIAERSAREAGWFPFRPIERLSA